MIKWRKSKRVQMSRGGFLALCLQDQYLFLIFRTTPESWLAMKLACLLFLPLAKQRAKWWDMHSYQYGNERRVGATLHYIKASFNRLTSAFASVLLLIVNFVITLSKKLWIRRLLSHQTIRHRNLKPHSYSYPHGVCNNHSSRRRYTFLKTLLHVLYIVDITIAELKVVLIQAYCRFQFVINTWRCSCFRGPEFVRAVFCHVLEWVELFRHFVCSRHRGVPYNNFESFRTQRFDVL